MTADKAIEGAIYSALKTAFSGQTINIVPFVAVRNAGDNSAVVLPAVQFAADPWQASLPGSTLGYVTVRLVSRTQSQDDPTRATMEANFETAAGVMLPATLGPLVDYPWLVCGVDNGQEGAIAADADENTQDKARTYRVAMWDATGTITTTTTTTTGG